MDITNICNEVASSIVNDIKNGDISARSMILNAYNEMQRVDNNAAHYLYDINNHDDLRDCVIGGMTTREVADLFHRTQCNLPPYFFFGSDYETPKPIGSWEDFKEFLCDNVDEILEEVLLNPYDYKSFEVIYRTYFPRYFFKELK